MTATTHTTDVKPASIYSTVKRKGGATELDATALSALGLLTTGADVSAVLDILSANEARANAVTSSGIGKATHVDA